MTGLSMLMRVEPAGGGRVRDRETGLPGGAWRNGLVRAAVDLRRDHQAMPVRRGGLVQIVANPDRGSLAARRVERGWLG